MADQGGIIPERWTFKSGEVAAGFDAHVREQLPWYDLATGAVAHFVRAYLPENGLVIDLGASTGNIGRAVADTLTERKARLIAVEPAREMIARYTGPGEIVRASAEEVDFDELRADVVVAFLCLQFIRPTARARLISKIVRSLPDGGAAIIVDRMVSLPGYLGQTIGRLTLAAKYEAGATPEQIIRKELSLVGVQRPLYPSELSGFVEVFRFGDFAAWVLEK